MDKYLKILKQYWGYDSFRPLQLEIILSVAEEKKDTLGLLPTGGGKSIIFQVPTLAMEGMNIVITPLIALMKDQVENLQKRNIPAVAIHSGMDRKEIELDLDRCVDGYYKFLYISPERLHTRSIINRLQYMNISLLTVDEAHCISQWGYDFRPSYLKIAEIRDYLPDVPILALTASATPQVVDDIQEKLRFRQKNVFRKSFARENLIYSVRHSPDKLGDMLRITAREKGTGIIYVRSRRRTEEIASLLKNYNISADYYHAGIKHSLKEKKQNLWKNDKIRVIVATNAFGMGIDKPDVRFVLHLDLPESLEAYYQEAGRGGRDGKPAKAIILYNQQDIERLRKSVETSFPPIKTIRRIYSAVCNYLQIPIGAGAEESYPFNLAEFSVRYKFPPILVYNSLRLLQKEGYLEFTEEITEMPKLYIKAAREDVYRFQVENPPFDPFLKVLMRSYEGIMEHYVPINEFWLAKVFKSDVELVRKYLKKLTEYGIADYKPFTRSNFIYFPQPRVRENDIVFKEENYKFLKQRYIEQIEAVISYVENTKKCRSQMLLEYFGEKKTKPCGKCDVCISKSFIYSKEVENQILQLLEHRPMSLQEIIKELNISKIQAKISLKSLIKKEKIIFTGEQKFALKDASGT